MLNLYKSNREVDMLMNRRTMLSVMATATLAGVVGRAKPARARVSAQSTTGWRTVQGFAGPNLENWHTSLGDALFPAGDVVLDDIHTEHLTGADAHASCSLLCANVERRPVMAHNITYLRRRHEDLLDRAHHCGYDFRIPYELVADAATELSAETFEGGFFVWDGSVLRRGATEPLDYGIAFQIVLNPWLAEPQVDGAQIHGTESCAMAGAVAGVTADCQMGEIRRWTGSGWERTGEFFAVDTEVHRVEMVVDFLSNTGMIKIDDIQIDTVITETPKVGWGRETDARLQVETVSKFPGCEDVRAMSQVEVSNWFWYVNRDDSAPRPPREEQVRPTSVRPTGDGVSNVFLPLVSPPYVIETPVASQTVEPSIVLRWKPDGVAMMVQVYKRDVLLWTSPTPLLPGSQVDLPETGRLEIRLVAPDTETVCDAVSVWCIPAGAALLV